MDTFERALEAPCADENYKKGVELTFTQIQKAFEKLGVTEVAALGETFDPNLHNAIKQVDMQTVRWRAWDMLFRSPRQSQSWKN